MLNNLKEIIKNKLVGNFVGRKLLLLRDKCVLFHASIYEPHIIGTLANDQLAFKFVTSICKPNATFVDVGAHIGSIIAMVSFNLPNVKICAIEAIPEKIENLKIKFPLVELHSCAVGETTGQTTFYVNSTNPGYSTLGIPEKNNPDSINAINVNIKRLDDIINATDVDVIKIDVEGAELGVLRGAVKLIEQCRPTIMFESGPIVSSNLLYTKEDIYKFFEQINYSLVLPNRLAFCSAGLSLEAFLDSHIFPRVSTNFFAVPVERADEIMAVAYKKL